MKDISNAILDLRYSAFSGLRAKLKQREEGYCMVSYEFYWNDPIKGYQLIGVLPERRMNPERITEESVLNWAKQYFGYNFNSNEVFFHKVEIRKK